VRGFAGAREASARQAVGGIRKQRGATHVGHRKCAALQPNAADARPFAGPELKLLFCSCATASRPLQVASANTLLGAATAAPRRFVARGGRAQLIGRVVGRTRRRGTREARAKDPAKCRMVVIQ
jgi:hypothetical protein